MRIRFLLNFNYVKSTVEMFYLAFFNSTQFGS